MKVLQGEEAEAHEITQDVQFLTNNILAMFAVMKLDMEIGVSVAMNVFILSYHAYCRTTGTSMEDAMAELEQCFQGMRDGLRANWDKDGIATKAERVTQ